LICLGLRASRLPFFRVIAIPSVRLSTRTAR
jgi:hypothetical protein